MDPEPIQHIEIIDGKAYIAGRKLKPKLLGRFFALGSMTIEEIMEEWTLSRAEVHAAVAYYYDHQEELERTRQEQIEQATRNGAISIDEFKAKVQARLANKESP